MLTPFLLALQFLTVIPTPAARNADDGLPRMERALPWFPLVGALLGVVLATVDALCGTIFTISVRGALVLTLSALLTGMLHLDGFADCCDGLLGTRSPARRLEIMRDSRVGAYGVIGIGLLLLLFFTALGALPPGWRFFALVAAPTLSRWSMVLAIVQYPYARASGAGSAFHARSWHLLGATLTMAAALVLGAIILHRSPWPILVLAGISLIVTQAWTAWASRRLGGGLTGDTYGALNELVALSVLLFMPLCARIS